uniref:Uncharacterized protein n=1 Tax=Cucumis melo TaxID=3656 RepID=A0A9I9EGR0_CUCME
MNTWGRQKKIQLNPTHIYGVGWVGILIWVIHVGNPPNPKIWVGSRMSPNPIQPVNTPSTCCCASVFNAKLVQIRETLVKKTSRQKNKLMEEQKLQNKN